jgi:quercetin dioxygenase-like cupin family protein
MKDRKIQQVLSGKGYQWEWGGQKKRVKEGKYGRCILYSCLKIEQ